MRMKNCYIAKANDPFWILFESFEIDRIDDPAKSISSPCT